MGQPMNQYTNIMISVQCIRFDRVQCLQPMLHVSFTRTQNEQKSVFRDDKSGKKMNLYKNVIIELLTWEERGGEGFGSEKSLKDRSIFQRIPFVLFANLI